MSIEDRAQPRDEKALPRPETTEEPSAPPRSDVIVRGAATRCPHCHDSVSAEDDAWAACRACLARHHVACWGEGGQCAACGEKRFVSSVTTRAGAPRAAANRHLRLLAAGLALLSAGLGIGLLGAKIEAHQLREATVLHQDENARLRRELESVRAEAPPKIPTPGREGITTRTFTAREHRQLVYRPSFSSFTTVLSVPSSTLDEFAVVIAKHVIGKDSIREPDDAREILEKVHAVMAQDPNRKDDDLVLEKALAILSR